MKRITLLSLMMFYLGASNLIFGTQAIANWPALSAQAPPALLAWLVTGKLAWGVIFGVTAWSVGRLKAWGRKLLLAAITLYQAHIWLNHLLFDVSEYSRQVWPFEAGVSLITLAAVWGLACLPSLRRPQAKE